MLNFFFFIVGVIQLGIAITGTRYTRKYFSSYALLILAVVYGLALDNIVIATGVVLGEGGLTKSLNWMRFAIHALLTPTMMIASFGILRHAGVRWAQSRLWHVVICVLSTTLIILGSYSDIIQLDLVPKSESGVFRYVNDFHLLPGPPIPAVVTILVVLIFGIVLWRHAKWPWLFAGALFMFATAGATGVPFIANIGEIAIAGGLVASVIRFSRRN